MSTQVDERIVSLKFDNAQFEKNTATTMSTLDKLKAKLSFKGANKGLEGVSASAKKVDLSPIGNSAEKIGLKFNAMYSIADQAMRNITNSVMATGKKMISALTIDPIKTGFQEYETQINAVQTILANTQSKGSTIDDVNKALEELNTYADKTIYNFTEMTRNIGTFTAAGVDLETSTNAIQGIANLAAVSGSTSQQASTAMYQLSQALSSGSVKLQDWNSVVNAGMGGQVFQDALKETARVHGINIDEMIKKQGSFRETLKDGWISSEILTETLQKFTLTTEGLTEEQIKANREMLKAKGYTDAQIDEIFKLGATATDAATKVKTFTQLWDVLKEAAQSGWSKTWKLIVGDFEEAKALLTPLADFLTNIINGMNDARNAVIESALGRSFKDLAERLKNILKPIKDTTDGVKDLVKDVKDYDKVVNEIIAGKWGNAPTRWQDLTKAGYDWAHAQNLVNERLGDSTRHSTKYKEATDAASKSTDKAAKASSNLSAADARSLEMLIALSDAELKAKGFTDDQIAAFRELERVSNQLGISIRDLVMNVDEIDGRWLLINTFKNAGKGLLGVFEALKQAWQEIFPPKSTEEKADGLFNIIAAIHKFSTMLNLFEADGKTLNETGQKIKRTFSGVVAVFDIARNIVGGALKIVWKLIQAVAKALGYADLSILDVSAAVGDALVAFRNWLKELNPVTKAIEWLAPILAKVIEKVREFAPTLKSAAQGAGEMAKEYAGVGANMISGLVKGLSDKAGPALDAIVELGKKIIAKIKEVLGIHSPSKVFFAIGGFIVAGLVAGLLSKIPAVENVFGNLGETISGFLSKIDWNKFVSAGLSSGLLVVLYKFAGAFTKMVSPLEGLGGLFEQVTSTLEQSSKHIANVIKNTSKVLKGYAKLLRAKAFEARAKGIKQLAIGIAILVGAILLLTLVKPSKLWNAVGVVAALAAVLVGISIAVSQMSKAALVIGKNGVQINSIRATLLAVGTAIMLMAISVRLLGKMKPDQIQQGFLGMVGCVVAMGALLFAYGKLVKGKAAQNMDKAGIMMRKMAVTLILMVIAIKLIRKLSLGDMAKGILFVSGFVAFVGALTFITNFAGKRMDKLGGTMIKISIAMLLMVGVVKMTGKLSANEMVKGLIFATGFTLFVAALVAIVEIAGNDVPKIGNLMLAISASMLIMVHVIKTIGQIKTGALIKGLVGIGLLTGIITALILVVKMVGNNAPKISLTIMAIAIALGVLAGVAVILGLINVKSLAKGIAAVAILGGVVAGLILCTRGAESVRDNLIMIAITMGVLAAAVGILSFIDGKKLATSTAALSAVLGMLALVLYASKSATGSFKTLIVLGSIILVLGTILYLLARLPVEQSASAANSLTIVMLSLAGVVVLLGKISINIMNALKGAVALTLMAIPLIAFAGALWVIQKMGIQASVGTVLTLITLMTACTVLLYALVPIGALWIPALLGALCLTAMAVPLLAFVAVLAVMQGVENAMKNVITLSLLATVCTVLLYALVPIGALWIPALLGALCLTAMAVPMIAFVGVLAVMNGVENATANAKLLITLMTAMADVLVRVALVAPLAVIGVAAMYGLTGLIVAIAGMVIAIGQLMTDFPFLEGFIDKGIPVLVKLATGIGEIISGFATGMLSGLPEIGQMLSDFINNATPFIDGVKMVDDSVLEGVGILTGAIIALTAASLLEAITSFMTLGQASMPALGTQLSDFINNASDFIEQSKNIDPSIMEGIKTLTEAILLITAGNLLESITSWLTGESSMSAFGTQLAELGAGLKGFMDAVGPLTKDQVKVAQHAADIIMKLAEASAAIPNTGGLLGSLVGDNDMGPWADQLDNVADGVSKFAKKFGESGLTKEQVEVAENAAKIISALAKAAGDIPNTGGLLADLLGDNDFSAWADQLDDVAKGVKGFIGAFGEDGLTKEQIDVANNAAGIISTLAKAASEIPNTGGLLADLVGDNDFSKWAGQLKDVGTGVAEFATAVGVLSPESLTSVNTATEAIEVISTMTSDFKKKDKKDFSTFGEGMVTLAGKIKSFATKLNEIDTSTMTTASARIKDIIKLTNDLTAADISGCKEFGESLKKVASGGVDGFVKGLTGEDPLTKMKNAASTMLKSFTDQLSEKTTGVETAFGKVAKSGASAMTSKEIKDMYTSAGTDLVSGFANGIKSEGSKNAVWGAGTTIGKWALKAAKEAIDSNSPSKEAYKIGEFFGQGLSLGIDSYGSKVYDSGFSVGEYAKNGLTNAIAKVKDIVEGKIDAQPTIRPVLDLSDVTSGARSIGNLLDINPTIGAASNARAINAMMRGNQNGVNNDVVSAIKDLKNSLNNQSGDNYNINGITYDDGSNISTAIKTITRAVRLEGRI